MLPEVHTAMQQILYERGQISPREVDIEFATPTREWIGQRMRPTVNFFLYAIDENTDLRQTSFQSTRVNGRSERRLPPRRVNVNYMVSAITTDADDEQRLLWRVLVTLMRFPELPPEALPEALRLTDLPLNARTAQPNPAFNAMELWGALGADPRPAIGYQLTLPVDLDLAISSPLVLTRTVRFGRSLDGSTEETNTQIGGVVRAADGAPVAGAVVEVVGSAAEAIRTNAEGEYTLPNIPVGTIDVHVTWPDGGERTVTIAVPSDSYEIVPDERRPTRRR